MARGGSRATATTGPSMSTGSTSRRRRMSTTRSMPSSSRSPTTRSCLATRWSRTARSTPTTGEALPVVTIVTDNGGPLRSFRFEAFIASHPELHHVRTRVRTPGQNGSRERGFGTLKYERLFIDDRRRDHARQARRGLPERIQRGPTSRDHRLEPAQGGAPGPGQPDHLDISNRENPANYLTRDKY